MIIEALMTVPNDEFLVTLGVMLYKYMGEQSKQGPPDFWSTDELFYFSPDPRWIFNRFLSMLALYEYCEVRRRKMFLEIPHITADWLTEMDVSFWWKIHGQRRCFVILQTMFTSCWVICHEIECFCMVNRDVFWFGSLNVMNGLYLTVFWSHVRVILFV